MSSHFLHNFFGYNDLNIDNFGKFSENCDAALGIAATMVVALATFHLPQSHPFVGPPGQPSFEPAAGYLAVMIVLMLIGPGALSFDFLLFGKKAESAEEEKGRASRWLQ